MLTSSVPTEQVDSLNNGVGTYEKPELKSIVSYTPHGYACQCVVVQMQFCFRVCYAAT